MYYLPSEGTHKRLGTEKDVASPDVIFEYLRKSAVGRALHVSLILLAPFCSSF